MGTILVSGTPVQAEKLERSLFKVEKMTCAACAAKIYNRLTQLDGVEGLLINIEKALIAVEHSETLAIDAIMSAMAEIDKPAKPVTASQIGAPDGVTETLPGWQRKSDGWLSKLFRIFDF